MKHLREYIVENIVDIFEGSSGINLSSSKNLQMFKIYLNIYFKDKKCIDGDKGYNNLFDSLSDFYKDEESEDDIFFYIKINSSKIQVCLYEKTISEYSEEELNSLGIYKIDNSINKYNLIIKTDNINWTSPLIESTQKKANKNTIKIWPDDLTIIDSWHPKNCDNDE
jgi:hypothetical protein